MVLKSLFYIFHSFLVIHLGMCNDQLCMQESMVCFKGWIYWITGEDLNNFYSSYLRVGRVWYLKIHPFRIYFPPSKDLLVSWIMCSDSKSSYLLMSWILFFKLCETLKNVTNFLSSLNTHHSENWGWKPSGKPAWDYFCFLYELYVLGLGSWGFCVLFFFFLPFL